MRDCNSLTQLGCGTHKFSDGEDPDEREASQTVGWTAHDIEIISNFSKLRILKIEYASSLSGRYPFFFNRFSLLQKLSIKFSPYLKWDLEMLVGLPVLKELVCSYNGKNMTGNINSLIVLKDTLEKVDIQYCYNVEGNFMNLADFPRLKKLNLFGTAVTGDIRDIGANDFSSLNSLELPKGVYGGSNYQLQHVSDVPDLVNTLHLLNKQRPALSLLKGWHASLSEDSPDWYDSVEDDPYGCPHYSPPLEIVFVQAGTRIGCRWQHGKANACEVNWLDPEPDRESSDYGLYIEELEEIESWVDLYKGFYRPPTEAEYKEIVIPLMRRDGLAERY